MRFTKMHGLGNNYLYINCFTETVTDPEALSIRLSDVHFGVGSDGIILIKPSDVADCEMDIYNADGSRAMMCGNGIRCVGKYVYERGIAKKEVLKVDTQSGIKTLYLNVKNGVVESIRVDMGEPELVPQKIPVVFDGDTMIDQPVTAGETTVSVTCVSMGNPHCVQFVEDTKTAPVTTLGPVLEHHPIFPERANIEFIQVVSRQEIHMRVWERGSGETFACGTGACASVVACVLNGKTDRNVKVHLLGGDLQIFWDPSSNHVFMEGPAAFICDGEWIASE
ncbi:MAG: diaminopimelate epimerase [Oscillospiraceae bacterium]|nr:diaminopimelate epimerase [Oscillospiraceae bacterium]